MKATANIPPGAKIELVSVEQLPDAPPRRPKMKPGARRMLESFYIGAKGAHDRHHAKLQARRLKRLTRQARRFKGPATVLPFTL